MTCPASPKLAILTVLALVWPALANAQVLHEISGMAWRDRVPDGVRASHESALGVPGLSVELRDAATQVVVRTMSTDEDGRYLFRVGSAQSSRSYRIRVALPTSRYSAFSPRGVGNDPAIDSDILPSGPNIGLTEPFVVTPTSPANNIDIGLIPRVIVLGNLAWFDRNPNGLQEGSEPGLQGILVEAWSQDRTVRFDQKRTDPDGKYGLEVPGWGPYRLRFEAPVTTSFTLRDVGNDPFIDSDVISSAPNTGWTPTVNLAENVITSNETDGGYVIANGGVDVALDYAPVPNVVYPGFGTSWSLRIREGLGRPITSIRVQASVPSGIQGMSWTCLGIVGAICPSSGVNALDFTTSLPSNGELHITFFAQVATNAAPVITVSASATVAEPQWDAVPYNSAAQLELRNDQLFRNGFQ